METHSVQADVHRLFEKMYAALSRPIIDRDRLRDLTYQAEALTMAHAYPGESSDFTRYNLTKHEEQIAVYLKQRFGRPVTKDALLAMLYVDRPEPPEIKIIDVFICKIRRKLMDSPWAINVSWGHGYTMVAREDRLFTPGERTASLKGSWHGISMPKGLCVWLAALEALGGTATTCEWANKAGKHKTLAPRYYQMSAQYLAGSGYAVSRKETISVPFKNRGMVYTLETVNA